MPKVFVIKKKILCCVALVIPLKESPLEICAALLNLLKLTDRINTKNERCFK